MSRRMKEAEIVIVLMGSVSRPKWEPIVNAHPYLGFMVSPLSWRKPWCAHYACDNDAFSGRFNELQWLKMLDKVTNHHSPLFVLLPDVVADWDATLERGRQYIGEVRGRGLPVGIALQNGCVIQDALQLTPDYLFVGGSTDWKWDNAPEIIRTTRGTPLRVHIGRVNGRDRIRQALMMGADSIDGTGFNRFSDAMLPALFGAQERFAAQVSAPWMYINE